MEQKNVMGFLPRTYNVVVIFRFHFDFRPDLFSSKSSSGSRVIDVDIYLPPQQLLVAIAMPSDCTGDTKSLCTTRDDYDWR